MERITQNELDPEGEASDATAECIALVIVWSSAEPERVGEVAFVPSGKTLELGRGEDARSDRIRFVRQHPEGNEPRPALGGPGLSRAQLRLLGAKSCISYARVGRCLVTHNGVPSDRGQLAPGDVLTIKNQLVLLCVLRPTELEAPRHFTPSPSRSFGEPDEHGIVGESPTMWALREDLALIASARAHVLVTGPSGSGKELVSRAVHRLSGRASGPLVARSAATLPASLVDAELFGNLRNYPNPGMAEREGLIGAAHGGTLFLDEIGELSGEAQAHLLRVLDAGEFHRLGESRARTSDVRVVAATNRELDALKDDLASRFDLRIEVPGLEARREDVPLLCRRLVLEIAAQLPTAERFLVERDGVWVPRLQPGFVEALMGHRFSLHLRELRELLWRSSRESKGDVLECPRALPRLGPATNHRPKPESNLDVAHIREVVERHGSSTKSAAAELGLTSRFVLYRLMRKHGIRVGDKADTD